MLVLTLLNRNSVSTIVGPVQKRNKIEIVRWEAVMTESPNIFTND